MNPYLIIVIILAVAFIGYDMYMSYKRKSLLDKLTEHLLKGELQDFDDLMAENNTRKMIPPFNYEYLQLSRAMMGGSKNRITQLFDQFKTRRLNPAQKREIAIRGFNYFLEEKNNEQLTYYRDQINSLPDKRENAALKEEVNTYYRVTVEGRTDILDELLEKTEKLPEKYRGMNEYLISQIYEHMGNKEKTEEYLNLSRKHMEMLSTAPSDGAQ